jgi:hypothetical protein
MKHLTKTLILLLTFLITTNAFAVSKSKTSKVCLTYEEVDKRGKILGIFHATNEKNRAIAENRLEKIKYYTNSEIHNGTCQEMSEVVKLKCSEKNRAVCSNTPKPYSSYENFCTFTTKVMSLAGKSKSFKSSWTEGQCPDNHCLYYETISNDSKHFFAINTKSYSDSLNKLEKVQNYSNDKITIGSCKELADSIKCDKSIAPLCSDAPNAFSEYPNYCSFKKEVLKTAGVNKGYDGIYSSGKCPVTCNYQNYIYQAGERFNAGDKCNSCVCGYDGKVSCTVKSCSTWNFKYRKSNKTKGSSLKLKCSQNTVPFKNKYGSGCKQADFCPPKIYCTATSSNTKSSYCRFAPKLCPFTKLIWH